MFDWPRFLDAHRIEYATTGANVARGNIVVHCPLCGSADPSMHMSIALEGEGWRCWRDRAHRGRSPVYLISRLLGCSIEHAATLAGVKTQMPADFLGQVNKAFATTTTAKPAALKIPSEFQAFFPCSRITSRPYLNYLRWKRHYATETINLLTNKFGIRFCTSGPYQGRIIFPIHYYHDLVCWTGRSISKDEPLRYKSLSTNPEKAKKEGLPAAAMRPTDCLLWHNKLLDTHAKKLFICEGPFDALRVWVIGGGEVAATCLFGNQISAAQIELLYQLLPRFKERYLLLDSEEFAGSIEVGNKLAPLGVHTIKLPAVFKDPDELRTLDW